ncbi:MAG: hypothetical protein SGARI_001894 [Bacillariaceae sp.]
MPTATRKQPVPQSRQLHTSPPLKRTRGTKRNRTAKGLLRLVFLLCLVLLITERFFYLVKFIQIQWVSSTSLAFAPLLTRHRRPAICDAVKNSTDPNEQLWKKLCQLNFTHQLDSMLNQGKKANVVQIGAHVGFEHNDPVVKGLMSYLGLLSPMEKRQVVWTLVEPSPPNFARLQQNIHNLSESKELCELKAVQAAVVSDALLDEDIASLTFYGIRDTIDPETGYDKLSGKKLPYYTTQLSSYSEAVIMKHRRL